MIELLILHELNKRVLTLYGISKNIKTDFSVITHPSIGTIKPALDRMAESGYLTYRKSMSKGGRPSTYYSITETGKQQLKEYILEATSENPISFFNEARAKIYCANVLTENELLKLFAGLKIKAEKLMIESSRLTQTLDSEFFPKIILDNLTCEYKNFISMLEGMERACKH